MKKQWEHSVLVDAPVDHVYELVSDFSRHSEWDRFTSKVELVKDGDGSGVGAEWKVYEQFGLFSLGEEEKERKHATGLAKRVVLAKVANQLVSWHTNPVPNVGISADMSFEFQAEGSGTRVKQVSVVSVPGVVEKVGRLIVRNLDTRQQGQWTASLEQLKKVAEGAKVQEAVAV